MGGVPLILSAVLLAVMPGMHGSGERVVETSVKPARSRGSPTSETDELAAFLLMNPEEQFDLEVVNSIDTRALIEEARGEKRVLREVVRTAEALLPRVRAETEDPILVGAILRNKTLDWYRRSQGDPTWGREMPLRWGGIFHESRVPGGRLSRKLSARLVDVINDCVRASGPGAFLRAGFSGIFRESARMARMVQFGFGSRRPRLTQHVAQAYLDDLAANARNGDTPLPMEHLSELARRNGSSEVNITLVELFRQQGTGSLTVIDRRFHPEMNALSVRVTSPKGPDEAATYDLHQTTGHLTGGSDAPEDATADSSSDSPWEREDMEKKDWLEMFRLLEKRKARLGAPPRENSRDRPSYLGLRDAVMDDPLARKAFLKVHWKGTPRGLVLLCQLLLEGTLTPDVETDGDYLEAELDHLDKGRGGRRSKGGDWKIGHGWTVVREVAAGNVRTYRAQGKSAD